MHSESINTLAEIARENSTNNKIVFVSGNFNIVHPGHLRLLKFAREYGGYLVVGIYGNESKDALLDEELRLESVKSISFVDHAFILRDKPEHFIEQLRPAVVVKGKEHELLDNPELTVLSSYGGKLLFSSGDVSFSSIDLLKKEFSQLNYSTIIAPQDFPSRHEFTMEDLDKILGKMNNLEVCVIGDTIVDEYITCDPLGMSQEDPTIVVTPVMSEKYIGGAAIVAAHARGLGAKVNFFSIVGKDETANIVRRKMQEYDVNCILHEDDSRPTTLKQRYRANGKTLLRVSHLRNQDISTEIRSQVASDLKKVLKEADVLIFSDFNYGCLPQELVD